VGFVSIWGVIWWFVLNFQSPFGGSTVVFDLLKLDFFGGSREFWVYVWIGLFCV